MFPVRKHNLPRSNLHQNSKLQVVFFSCHQTKFIRSKHLYISFHTSNKNFSTLIWNQLIHQKRKRTEKKRKESEENKRPSMAIKTGHCISILKLIKVRCLTTQCLVPIYWYFIYKEENNFIEHIEFTSKVIFPTQYLTYQSKQ